MKKNKNWLFIVILLLGITVGYASLSRNLSITGAANVSSNTWNVKFIKIEDEQFTGSTTGKIVENATIKTTNKENDTINFKVNLSKPGDTYTFKAYRGNLGTIDATLDSYTVTGLEGSEKFLTLKIDDPNAAEGYEDSTYSDGNLLSKPDLLIGDENYITITLTFEKDITEEDLLTEAKEYDVSIQLNYIQK